MLPDVNAIFGGDVYLVLTGDTEDVVPDIDVYAENILLNHRPPILMAEVIVVFLEPGAQYIVVEIVARLHRRVHLILKDIRTTTIVERLEGGVDSTR